MLPIIKIKVERWKWNEAHEMWVSTEGRIKDRDKELVEPMINDKGYLVFFSEKTQKFLNIHRLVLETWRPREDMRELTVEHKDQNKRNPALRNLMWLTENENSRRAKYHNLAYKQNVTGSANKRILANGVNMTVEEAVTLIHNLPLHNFSKIDIRTKVNALLNGEKQKKQIYGITFTEVKE